MEVKVTITITTNASDAKDVLDFITSHPHFADFDLRVTSSEITPVTGVSSVPILESAENATEDPILSFIPTAEFPGLRHFLSDTDRKIMKFADERNGQFLNADLATELGVDTPLTCFPLGRITRKLQKAGVNVEGAQGENWYTKHKTTHGTLLSVRPDVLEKFREALHD
jgi:hypothetical protein